MGRWVDGFLHCLTWSLDELDETQHELQLLLGVHLGGLAGG